MDFHLKQWRSQQHESEEEQEELLHQQQHSAKIPKQHPIGNPPHDITTNFTHQYHKPELSSVSPLPLFAVPPDESDHQQQHPNNPIKLNFSPPTSLPSSRLPRMGSGYFSLAQWQELELQALIFRYMLAGATVPSELLNPIRKSLTSVLNLNTPSQYFLSHHHHHHHNQYYPHYLNHQQQPAWYWGRAAVDPEPGRCRRTDGKKWRCSRDVVVGQKYCERHMHRGRHRSRKPVETPSKLGGGGGGAHFALSGKLSSATNSTSCTTNSGGGTNNASSITSIDVLRLGQSSLDVKRENSIDLSGEAKSDCHVLRHFFDDWPRSHQESDNSISSKSSATSLSISMPGNLPSSDVSLKLATGDGDKVGHAMGLVHSERQSGWATGWSSSPMGGPLAEALRSSSNSESPTSVLHQLPRGSASETCIVGS